MPDIHRYVENLFRAYYNGRLADVFCVEDCIIIKNF